ncbi:MAG TPA: hypothetical protein VH482_07385 [Thermomicrobiales bacterium]
MAEPTDRRLRRWVASLAAVAVLVTGAVVGVLLIHDPGETVPTPVTRADAVADLLAWIPATDQTRHAFAVWSEDPGGAAGTPVVNAGIDPLIDRLGLSPVPSTLGRSAPWRARFGYGARDVQRWVTAGGDAPIAVLGGDFDRAAIETALTDAGYRKSTYHGVPVYVLHDVATPSPTVDGDAIGAANAVALYAGRVITSASPAAVRGAIDAAQGRVPSLADDPEIAVMLQTLAPISGLVAVDAADQAIDCGIGGSWSHRTLPQPSGRYVVVGYGRLGAGGERRTLVAANLADAVAAGAALDKYAAGWNGGIVMTTGAGAEIAAYGRLTAVGQTDNLLIAELVDGREDGWVRAAIRFARPVCELASTALPAEPPQSSPAAQT